MSNERSNYPREWCEEVYSNFEQKYARALKVFAKYYRFPRQKALNLLQFEPKRWERYRTTIKELDRLLVKPHGAIKKGHLEFYERNMLNKYKVDLSVIRTKGAQILLFPIDNCKAAGL